MCGDSSTADLLNNLLLVAIFWVSGCQFFALGKYWHVIEQYATISWISLILITTESHSDKFDVIMSRHQTIFATDRWIAFLQILSQCTRTLSVKSSYGKSVVRNQTNKFS